MTRRTVLLALWPDILVPRLIYKVRPVYPKVARDARIEGMVRLKAWINEEGRVEKLQLISGHPFLVKAAMDAVRQWRWLPERYMGRPVSFRTEVSVGFSLKDEEERGPVVSV